MRDVREMKQRSLDHCREGGNWRKNGMLGNEVGECKDVDKCGDELAETWQNNLNMERSKWPAQKTDLDKKGFFF